MKRNKNNGFGAKKNVKKKNSVVSFAHIVIFVSTQYFRGPDICVIIARRPQV